MIIVGTLESSDCLITIIPAETLIIEVDSIVYDAFGQQICHVIKHTLAKANITKAHIICQDKGALDYTIKARLETAIARYQEEGF